MQFVEVFVADAAYHGSGALTYSSTATLKLGDIVTVPLKKNESLAIVVGITKKPRFPVRPISTTNTLRPLPGQTLSLLKWLQIYYPAPLGILTQLLLPKTLPAKPTPTKPLPLSDDSLIGLPPLTSNQKAALQRITGPGLYILHGETGSGKTRVYMELAHKSIAAGRSVIILTPEIGLTSQIGADFEAIFGERVVIVHSKLTNATRQRLWQYVLEQSEPLILIGPRSALFYPLANIGLIVVDEAHETAYKQDKAPYYHATTVAGKLSSLYEATLVLGSATPLVTDYYIATAKKRPIIRMNQTATGTTSDPAVTTIVDLRNRKNFIRSPYLSDTLIAAIKNSLQKGEQSLLFLNRRGTARIIFCERCGWQAECPHCDLPLVYHGDTHRMRCHSCNFLAQTLTSCPECRNPSIVFKAIGTKAIAEETTKLFPEAKIMRFDTDNAKKERIEEHYKSIRSGEIDILVGTQTLAKGLDLPNLGVVGVVIAETGLYFPDFSAKERTYQLLVQVLGRVGRGHRGGQIVVQTYTPDSLLLRAAIRKDWNTFLSTELAERRLFTFPPYCYLLKLTCKRATSASASRAALLLAETLRSAHHGIRVEGPAPSFHEKTAGKFGWQIIIKAKKRTQLTDVIQALPSGWSYDIDPMNLL